MNKNIEPRNNKREQHGLWEKYWSNGQLEYKGNYVNSQRHGYWEEYYYDGRLEYKGNYVNNQQHGYWEHYFTDGEVCYKGYYDMGKKVDYEVNVDTPSKDMFPIY
jgi:antitoxin component YwqK of YwqJK toxin-antitoxin module